MSPVPLHLRASAAYRDAEAHPPARQIVLLHDSAIRNLEEARSAIGAKRIEARFNRVTKAHAIVAALQSCLDFDRGGEIAQVLDRLYGHILNRLMLINLHNDPAICDELVLLLERMRVGWAELASGPSRRQGPSRAADCAVRLKRCRSGTIRAPARYSHAIAVTAPCLHAGRSKPTTKARTPTVRLPFARMLMLSSSIVS